MDCQLQFHIHYGFGDTNAVYAGPERLPTLKSIFSTAGVDARNGILGRILNRGNPEHFLGCIVVITLPCNIDGLHSIQVACHIVDNAIHEVALPNGSCNGLGEAPRESLRAVHEGGVILLEAPIAIPATLEQMESRGVTQRAPWRDLPGDVVEEFRRDKAVRANIALVSTEYFLAVIVHIVDGRIAGFEKRNTVNVPWIVVSKVLRCESTCVQGRCRGPNQPKCGKEVGKSHRHDVNCLPGIDDKELCLHRMTQRKQIRTYITIHSGA